MTLRLQPMCATPLNIAQAQTTAILRDSDHNLAMPLNSPTIANDNGLKALWAKSPCVPNSYYCSQLQDIEQESGIQTLLSLKHHMPSMKASHATGLCYKIIS